MKATTYKWIGGPIPDAKYYSTKKEAEAAQENLHLQAVRIAFRFEVVWCNVYSTENGAKLPLIDGRKAPLAIAYLNEFNRAYIGWKELGIIQRNTPEREAWFHALFERQWN